MAKKPSGASARRETETDPRDPENAENTGIRSRTFQIPEGYVERSGDLVGTWDDELSPAIHFIPLEIKLFDSKQEAEKPSVLIVGELFDDAPLIDRDKNEVDGRKGDLIGVWAKPGMRGILGLQGVPVFMFEEGELDTGKQNPMKLFKCHSRVKGKRLQVSEDFRDKSKGRKCWAIRAESMRGHIAGPSAGDDGRAVDPEGLF